MASPVVADKGIGKTIKRIRCRAGLSQAELAQETGISQPYLSQVEQGNLGLDPQSLKRINEILGRMDIRTIHWALTVPLEAVKEEQLNAVLSIRKEFIRHGGPRYSVRQKPHGGVA